MCSGNRRFGGSKSVILWFTTLFLTVGCNDTENHPSTYADNATDGGVSASADSCASPKEGCPCSEPGEIVDCGKVTVKVDNYETCFEGSRLCAATGVWGACEPDQVIADNSRQVSGLVRR
jgi:hypothetical protein